MKPHGAGVEVDPQEQRALIPTKPSLQHYNYGLRRGLLIHLSQAGRELTTEARDGLILLILLPRKSTAITGGVYHQAIFI